MTQAYIICGSPGAGKSSYGKALAQSRNAAFIDIDTATERLVRLALSLAGRDPDDRDSPYFKTHFRDPVYQALFDTARENLGHMDVVITGPFTRELRDPDWPERLCRELGAPVEVHYVYCRPETRHLRLRQRDNPRDQGKFKHWASMTAYYGDESRPGFDHVFVDNTEDHKAWNLALGPDQA